MSFLDVMLVGALGGLGALLRFGCDAGVSARVASALPLGTLVVNLVGAFLLGAIFGALAPGSPAYLLLGTGLLGGFTTFSTWALESHRLAQEGQGALAVANFLLSLMVGIIAVWAGRQLGVAL